MIYGLYQSAAGMMTNDYRQSVIANNLANAETVGFKRDVAVFEERLRASEAGQRFNPSNGLLEALSGGHWLGETETDFSDGSLIHTGKPLDVALEGPGFLMVQVDGRELLTRDGRMRLDETGRLVASTDGAPILSRGGGPILLEPEKGPFSIDQEGRIHQNGREVGRLGLVDVDDYRLLEKAGTGRYVAPAQGRFESAARVHGEAIETSGVRPVPELVNMIEASRSYEMNARMVSLQDEMAGRLINQVARV